MSLLIDEEGKVRKADLVRGEHASLNQAALKAIFDFEFKPANVGGKPVAVQITYSYNFVLE